MRWKSEEPLNMILLSLDLSSKSSETSSWNLKGGTQGVSTVKMSNNSRLRTWALGSRFASPVQLRRVCASQRCTKFGSRVSARFGVKSRTTTKR